MVKKSLNGKNLTPKRAQTSMLRFQMLDLDTDNTILPTTLNPTASKFRTTSPPLQAFANHIGLLIDGFLLPNASIGTDRFEVGKQRCIKIVAAES